MQKIITNLWYDTQAEQAAEFYCSLFADSKITRVLRYNAAGPREAGSVMQVDFTLNGQQFSAINGGGDYHYTHAMSLLINCDDQAEVDRLWTALTADGGQEIQCGWLADKYGVNWQVWPVEAEQFLEGESEAAVRATAALFEMKKVDVQALRAVYEGTNS